MDNNRGKLKLKDTKLGEWFRNKAPQTLDAIGDLVPGGQAVKAIGALIDATTTSDEEREMAHALLAHAEAEDRANARSREVAFTQATGKRDWMQTAVGIVGMIAFLLMIWWATQGVEEREVYFHLLGVVEGVAVTIYGYYYGASQKD
jgi:hypothetical protein